MVYCTTRNKSTTTDNIIQILSTYKINKGQLIKLC